MKSSIYFIYILACIALFTSCSPIPEASKTIYVTDNLWTIELDQSDPLVVEPTINKDILYIQTNKTIAAYDLSTGISIWKSTIPHAEVQFKSSNQKPVLVKEGWVIVTQIINNSVYVFSKTTGELIWSTETENLNQKLEGGIEDVIFNNGILYIAKHNRMLSAYIIENGNASWRKPVPERRSLEIIAYRENIILGTMDMIAFYDMESGNKKLSIETPGNAWDYTLDQDYLYIYLESGECSITSLNLITMKYDWCNTQPKSIGFNNINMKFDENHLFLYGGSIAAITKTTGDIYWKIDSQNYKEIYLDENYIFAPDDAKIIVISKNTGIANASLVFENQNRESKWLPIIYNEMIIVFNDIEIDAFKKPTIN